MYELAVETSGFAISGLFLCCCTACLVCFVGKNDRQRGTSRMIGYMRGRVDMYVNPKEGPNCPGPAFPYHEAALRNDSDAPAHRMGAGYGDKNKVSELTFTIGNGKSSAMRLLQPQQPQQHRRDGRYGRVDTFKV